MLRHGLNHLLETLSCIVKVTDADARPTPCRPDESLVHLVLATEYARSSSPTGGPQTDGRTLVVVDTGDHAIVEHLVISNAAGFVELSQLTANELAQALQRVVRGETPMPEFMVRFLRRSSQRCDTGRSARKPERSLLNA